MRIIITTLLLVSVATTFAVTDASAQRRRAAPQAFDVAAGDSIPLTVNRRSWLDPGNSAPTGGSSGPAYVSANTAEFTKTPQQVITPDKFGNSTLPGQPYVPGRTLPVVSFATTPRGGVDVDNIYHYQPY